MLQVAATVGCKCYGIEKAEIPAQYAEVSTEKTVVCVAFGQFLSLDCLDCAFHPALYTVGTVQKPISLLAVVYMYSTPIQCTHHSETNILQSFHNHHCLCV